MIVINKMNQSIFKNEVNFIKKIIKKSSEEEIFLNKKYKKAEWLYMFIKNKLTHNNNNLINIFLESKIDMNSIIGQQLFQITTENNNRHEFIHIIILLLELGADVNHLINNNETLLHIATYMANINFCIILIKKGANINIKNLQNKTPLDIIGGLFDNYLFRLTNNEKKEYQILLRNIYIKENNWKHRSNFMQFLSWCKRNNYRLQKIFEVYDILRYITSFI